MASSSSPRSQLIDITYDTVALIISGHREGTRPDQLSKILEPRIERLQRVAEPFAQPSEASRKKLESGSVKLTDGVTITVEDFNRELAFALSDRFQIDEVEAFVLVRSFLYNEGLPEFPEDQKSSVIEEVITRITPFYYSERLYIARTLVALLKSSQTQTDPFFDLSKKLLEKIIPKPTGFTKNLAFEFERKSELPIPGYASKEPKAASQWAKQNAKEQLVLVEVLFWLLWDFCPITADVSLAAFQVAYSTDFGYKQANATSMLDEEGTQIQRDLAALWVLITIETLQLEYLADTVDKLPEDESDIGPLHASPTCLLRIHLWVITHPSPGCVCTMLAWAFYLKALSDATSKMAERPRNFVPFLREIKHPSEVAFKKGEKEVHATMVDACLQPESGLFTFLNALLASPLFMASSALRTGSSITDANDIAYRALIKGLLMALVDYQPVELIPDFEGFVETWIALFGNSESPQCAGLCKQFWEVDWRLGNARRAIVDVVRSRFPVQFRRLVRILRAMSGAVRPQTTDPDIEGELIVSNRAERQLCASYVYYFFRRLPTYTQVIPAEARAGVGALYDRIIDRPGPSSTSGGTAYTNLRPITLPGGSQLPAKSVGRLLCSDSTSDPVVVAWQHEYSGWKLLVDVLLDYINRRRGTTRPVRQYTEPFYGKRSDVPITLQLDDIGIERDSEDEAIVADSLELVLSIIQGNLPQAEQLMLSLDEGGQPVSYNARDTPPPDLVQLTFMILEDALSRAQSSRSRVSPTLVAPALDILSTLLSLPTYRNRVWLSLRSTSVLFGSDREANFESAILTTERASGHYVMTLAVLRLVRTLFEETIASLLSTQTQEPRLQPIKEEVLMRAISFIHGQIWVEYSGWRYFHLGDRFEIGRSIVALYTRIIETSSVVATTQKFTALSAFVADVLLYQATSSTVTPLVHTIASGRTILDTLTNMRRFSESVRFTALLADSLHLMRLVLYLKIGSPAATKHTMLEQALCTDHSAGGMLLRAQKARVNPVDMLAHYVKQRELGVFIPREAARTLTALCTSLSACTPSPPSLIGYLSDAEATMASLVKILRHPYDDLELRNAIWTFVCTAVEKQPALAVLFVAGQFRIHPSKGKEKAIGTQEGEKASLSTSTKASASAVEAACTTLASWKQLWEANPQLLASVMGFLDTVWNRSLEHLATLEPTRGDVEFWKHIAAITREELGPAPDYTAGKEIETEDGVHSNLHEAVSNHAYRTKVKAHALRILGSDVAMHLRSSEDAPKEKPASYKEAISTFQNEEHFTDAISEAISSSYDPSLYDQLTSALKSSFAPLTIESLRLVEPLTERGFGDGFMLSVQLLHDLVRLALAKGGNATVVSERAQLLVYSANLNMSLAQSQISLAESWCFLLDQVKGYLRGNVAARTILLTTAASVSRTIANEQRSGDFMSTIHGKRLQVLLALLEAAWFTTSETKQQIKSFMSLLENVNGIVISEAFPPGRSFMGGITNPFHRSLLLIIYYCARNCQQLNHLSQDVRAEHRLLMGRTFTTVLMLVIDALRLFFDIARTRLDVELDRDIELLVAVFHQCTRPGLQSSSTAWLTKCQETDVINASLKVFARADMSGLVDLDALRIRGQPLYAPQVLSFHMALASISFTAERLASESVIAAYSNNSISVALSEGAVNTTLPELPGERSPAHKAYCLMLANLTGIISNLISPQQFIESQVVGFVQLCGQQLSRALSWTNDDPLTLPFLEELELTVELFYLMVSGTSSTTSRPGSSMTSVSHTFTDLALLLLQHLNYALTHPRHLSGLLEPVTGEERLRIDRETSDGSVTSLNELLDRTKRPILSGIVRRLFGVTTNIISTLSIIGGAEMVLLNDPEEWPIREAIVVPHSKVTMGEPASIGTLLELGNCAYETLQFLTSKKTPSIGGLANSQQSDARIFKQALETVLVYASTQLVMWLSKHDVEQAVDIEIEDMQQQLEGHGFGLKADTSPTKDRERERRLRRKSLTLADRLRRGMTGEMTMDLHALVSKAKVAIAASSEMLGGPEPGDLLQLLATFLEDRVSVSV